MSNLTRTIASLALLKFNWDHRREDHLDAFIPLVATVLNKLGDRNILDADVHGLCRDFVAEFGFEVPYHPMIALLNRARKRGLVGRSQGRYVPIRTRLAEYDLAKKTQQQEASINGLVDSMIGFAAERLKRDFSREEALEGFTALLKSHDLDILFAEDDGSVLPRINASRTAKYAAARFIQHLRDSDRQQFALVVNIAIGHALASAIVYKGIERYTARLEGVHIYCDTGFLLRLVGAEGVEREQANTTLVKLLEANGATLHVFRHTYDEMMGILKGALQWVAHPTGYDPTKAGTATRFFVENSYTETDLERFIIGADARLTELGVSIADCPDPADLVDYQIDEGGLRDAIIRVYEQRRPFDENLRGFTIDRDIKSIAAVHKLRRGRAPVLIKQTGYLFLTTNYGLVNASARYEREHGTKEEVIPVSITDVFLGTVIWLQTPAAVTVVNETRLIAQCAAAIKLDAEGVKKLVTVAARLKAEGRVTGEQYLLLRSSRPVQEMLAEKALGDPDNFTAKTVDEVLADIEQAARKDEAEKYRVEQEAHRTTQVELASEQTKNAVMMGSVERFCGMCGYACGQAVFGLAIALILGGLILPFFPVIENKWLKGFCIVISVILWYGLFGWDHLKGIRARVSGAVKEWLMALAMRRLSRQPGSV